MAKTTTTDARKTGSGRGKIHFQYQIRCADCGKTALRGAGAKRCLECQEKHARALRSATAKKAKPKKPARKAKAI
jgi:hypothetical protein